jgi:3',5'-cyclic AMP phosphodiesterase CpdA
VAGSVPGEVPLGDVLVARLGDWVEAHSGQIVGDGAEEMRALGDAERATITLPDSLPQPPPFEPVETLPVTAPGKVLFRIAILGDLHIGSPAGEPLARAAIRDINQSGAALVIQLGDITDHGDRDEFELAATVLAELDLPCVTMMGNHDVFSLKEKRLSGREYYPQAFGRAPDGVLAEHEGVRIAVLDSVENGASPFAPFNLVTGTFVEGEAGGAVVRGALTPRQHDILTELATPGGPPAFVFLHHPPQPFTAFPPVLFGLRDEDSRRLHATCATGNVWGVFAGHTHRNARTRTYGSVPVQEVAIPRDYPFGYALIDVTSRGYAYRFMQIRDEGLLRDAYANVSSAHRRYALGSAEERAFVWAV